MQMHGIVTVLDESLSAHVRSLWDGLEKECGLTGIKITPTPHFTWQIAGDYDFAQLESVLKSIAASAKPFTMRCSGLGIFTGENPVLYISIVRDEQLSRFHRLIWERLLEFSETPSPYYSPPAWMPHITLAHRDLTMQDLPCALRSLAMQSFSWEARVDNLALVYQVQDQVGELRYRLDFAG
jgi:2'-5' RNA ligase